MLAFTQARWVIGHLQPGQVKEYDTWPTPFSCDLNLQEWAAPGEDS